MKQSKNLTALLLAAVMLASVSCGDSAAENKDTGAGADTKNAAAETEAAETLSPEAQNEASLKDAMNAMPEADYEGRTFTVMARNEQYSPVWAAYDVYAEETNGDPINDAVFRRNQILEEHYHIKIAEKPVHLPASDARKSIAANDDSFDLVTDGLIDLSALTSSGYLYNLYDLKELKLDSPWWDQTMLSDLSVAEKVFLATGDISIMDNEGTWCILFNKKLVSDYDFEDPYALVRDGKWTLSRMHQMAKEVTKDLNGDGVVGSGDQIGFLTESFNIFALWNGAGNTIAAKDENGMPADSFFNERSSAAYDQALEFQFDSCSGRPGNNPFPDYDDMNRCFTEGRGLFQYGAMGLISDYRESEVDFGVLPSPKFDEAQEAYHNTFSYANMTAYAVPTSASDVSRTATVMESMAELSRYTLTPAYLDISLKGKFTRDEESAETIDLILNTRSYDLGAVYKWGDLFMTVLNSDKESIGTMSSQYEKKRKALQKGIDRFIEDFGKME